MIAAIIRASARHPYVVVWVTLLLSALGVLAFVNAPLDAIPDTSDPQVIVLTEWEGRAADLVEDQITFPLTAALSSQPGVRVVRAQSYFGASFVTVIFEDGEDMLAGRQRVLEAITAGRVRLPEGARATLSPDASGIGWVLQYALSSDRHDVGELRTLQDTVVKPALLGISGVAEVATVGGFVEELHVTVDPVKLRAFRLDFQSVASAAKTAISDAGGDVVEMGGHEVMVRARGSRLLPSDIEKAVVQLNDSESPIRIADVATVALGPGPRRGIAELDGRGEVVGGIVVMRRSENALDVIERSKAQLFKLEPLLPAGVELHIVYDRSELIGRALNTLRTALTEEMLVVALVIAFFLFHLRSALIAVLVLPTAVLLSFLPIWGQGLTVNIMSLGGIAVAVGAFVDAAIVILENLHRKKDDPVAAMVEVGPSIFSSLLVMTVAFVPVFMLPGVEGRLFSPLAFAKTYAMGAGALLSITFIPALVMLLWRAPTGKYAQEDHHPVVRHLERWYAPVVRAVVRHPLVVIAFALLCMVATIPVFFSLKSELMPPLDEGTLLFMPTATPGMSAAEAKEVLTRIDATLRAFPEVKSVFGKMGRAETASDPAPLAMAEIVVVLKPKHEWRPGLSQDDLVKQLDRSVHIPGMPNLWWMPIQTRVEMLATGVRTPLGVHVKGHDAKQLEAAASLIAEQLKSVPGVRSVVADRLFGALAIDVDVDRDAIARYGLSLMEVHEVIDIAVGGSVVGTALDGRARRPVRVRSVRSAREDEDAIKNLIVVSPRGPVRMSDVARVQLVPAVDMIKSEDAELVATVYIDTSDAPATVAARAMSALEHISLPAGVRLEWSGQIEHKQQVERRLWILIPLVLCVIAVLIYASTGSLIELGIVFLAVPFSLIGAVWLLWALDEHMSIAVWVGMVALLGLDAETGVVMLLYLSLAHQKATAAGELRTRKDLEDTIVDGAARRLRPKLMTVMTDMIGLLPVIWNTDTGSDLMRPIAIPVVGGLASSFLLELLVYPALYALWKARALDRQA